VDITQRKKTEAYQEVLVHELQHRVKNILATVSSVAARRRPRVLARLPPTASSPWAACTIFSPARTGGARTCTPFIDMALAPYVDAQRSNVRIHGPEAVLAGPATTLGIHELATNAAKYGALSIRGGHIEVSWEVVGAEPQRISLSPGSSATGRP
jgi:two-component system CheB/CheR fusion protein